MASMNSPSTSCLSDFVPAFAPFSARSTRRNVSLSSEIGTGTLHSLQNAAHSRDDIVNASAIDLAPAAPRLQYSKKMPPRSRRWSCSMSNADRCQ